MADERRRACRGLAAAVVALAWACGSAVAAEGATTIVRSGHTDVGPFVLDGRVQLAVHQGFGEGDGTFGPDFSLVDDTIIAIGPEGRFIVPANGSGGNEWDALGPRGTVMWRLPQEANNNLPWLGLDGDKSGFQQRIATLQLEGMSGPGDLLLYEGGPSSPFINTRNGFPQARAISAHFHNSWVFTEPGLYCLALRALGRTAQGAQIDERAQLTVVTAEIDPATVTPCAKNGLPRPVKAFEAPPAAAAGTPVVARAGSWTLKAELRDGVLDVPLIRGSARDAGSAHRAEDVVFYSRGETSPAWPWEQTAPGRAVKTMSSLLHWDQLRVLPNAVRGDVGLALGAVDGPGVVSAADRGSFQEGRPVVTSNPAYGSFRDYGLWPGHTSSGGYWTASEPGVYCVPLTWSVTRADGTPLSVTKTLTLAFDEPSSRYDAASETFVPVAATIDPEQVIPCARRGEPTGRRVLSRGHIDLAARVFDRQLELSVREDSAAGEGPHRALPSVTLQAVQEAVEAVPADPAYAFLGRAGDPTWVLPQIQEDRLLWPGWSTEEIAPARLPGGVRWTLDRVRGPGFFTLFTTGIDGPRPLLDSGDGLPDALDIPEAAHAHGAWAFSKPGYYCMDLTVTATSASGTALLPARQTMLWAVGPVDPTQATESACGSDGPRRVGPDGPSTQPPPEPAPAPPPAVVAPAVDEPFLPPTSPSMATATPDPPARTAVPRRRPTVTLTLSRRRAPAGAAVRAAVRATAAGRPVVGTVRLLVDGRVRARGRLDRRGRRTLSVPRLGPGRHRITARFNGTGTVATGDSRTSTLTIVRR